MKELKFNEYNEFHVPFSEFDEYMKEHMKEGTFTKETSSSTYYFDSKNRLIGKYSDYLGTGTVYQ